MHFQFWTMTPRTHARVRVLDTDSGGKHLAWVCPKDGTSSQPPATKKRIGSKAQCHLFRNDITLIFFPQNTKLCLWQPPTKCPQSERPIVNPGEEGDGATGSHFHFPDSSVVLHGKRGGIGNFRRICGAWALNFRNGIGLGVRVGSRSENWPKFRQKSGWRLGPHSGKFWLHFLSEF